MLAYALRPDQKVAQAFIDQLDGTREVSETEPGIFRRTETTGDGYKVFALRSLMPKEDFTVHMAKMAYKDGSFSGVIPLQRQR